MLSTSGDLMFNIFQNGGPVSILLLDALQPDEVFVPWTFIKNHYPIV